MTISIAIMWLEVSEALIQVIVSAANMWVTFSIAIMHVGVSVAIMKVIFSAVHYAHDIVCMNVCDTHFSKN